MKFVKERTAQNLRAIRNLRSLSQQQLADKSGVSREAINNYERAITVMSLESAAKLADATAHPSTMRVWMIIRSISRSFRFPRAGSILRRISFSYVSFDVADSLCDAIGQ